MFVAVPLGSTVQCSRRTPFLLLICALIACSTASAAPADEWRLHGYNADEQRFSPLAQIDRSNVGRLGLAFSFDDFVVRGRTRRGTQATPLMLDATLYFTGPWSVVYAVDARTGELRWMHDPNVEGQWARHACCGLVNRGVAISGNRVFVGTLDGWLVALDRKSGAVLWRVDTLTDRTRSYTITGAPRLAGDLVVIGNGGAELGVRGYFSAYDIATGALRWRFFTVPGPGPDEHPEVAQARRTWGANPRWDLGGGGTVWDSMTYDERSQTLFVGVGNGGPWPQWSRNRSDRPSDDLFLSSILAIDARSGRLKWHYQTTPGDSWDYTATQNLILADLQLAGRTRPVVMQAPKNGFFYVLDRRTGELLSAQPFTQVTWATHVDLKTGRPVVDRAAIYRSSPRIVWPSNAGAHNWHPMAFNPQTGLVYIPTLDMPMKFTTQAAPLPRLIGASNAGASAGPPDLRADAELMRGSPPFVQRSRLTAWDPVTARVRWHGPDLPWWGGGVLTTGGGLVFAGAADGALYVYDARSGEVLRRLETGLAIMAPPMTYALDGVQYVAVLAGLGGAMNGRFHKGFVALERQNRERLLVFRLDGRAVDLPPRVEVPETQPLFAGLPEDEPTVALGRKRFGEYCARCHSFGGTPNGYPNLWNMPIAMHEAFEEVVLEGLLAYAGMPSFADALSASDVRAIHAFIAADQKQARRSKPPPPAH